MKLLLLFVFFAGFMSVNTLANAEQCDVPTTGCYGYTSTTSHFVCNVCPKYSGNCTWWAAYKRPDIARVVSGSGWNGGEWYGKLRSKGFDVGSQPKVDAIVEFSSPGHHGFEFDRARFVAYNQDMEQMKKDRKDWQSILLWSLVLSGLLFANIMRDQMSLSWVQEYIIFFISLFLILIWGFISGMSYAINGKINVMNQFVIICKPMITFFFCIFVFGIVFAVWGSIVDPIEKGLFIEKIFGYIVMGLFGSGILIGIPFITGYITGFIPAFLIHHALKLYRKHLKHHLEPC